MIPVKAGIPINKLLLTVSVVDSCIKSNNHANMKVLSSECGRGDIATPRPIRVTCGECCRASDRAPGLLVFSEALGLAVTGKVVGHLLLGNVWARSSPRSEGGGCDNLLSRNRSIWLEVAISLSPGSVDLHELSNAGLRGCLADQGFAVLLTLGLAIRRSFFWVCHESSLVGEAGRLTNANGADSARQGNFPRPPWVAASFVRHVLCLPPVLNARPPSRRRP